MIKNMVRFGFFALLIVLINQNIRAQTLDDAFRYLSPVYGGGYTTLGSGYASKTLPVYDNVFGNPAALGLIKQSQVGFGINFRNGSVESTLLNKSNSESFNNTQFNHGAFIYPYPVSQGAFVLAFGYQESRTYDFISSASALNANSSYPESINGYVDGLEAGISDLNNRLQDPYFLAGFESFLIDTVSSGPGTFLYRTTVFGNTIQSFDYFVEGGLNEWVIAGAIEVAKNIYVGANLRFISGSYKGDFRWREDADGNYYINRPQSGFTDENGFQRVFQNLQFKESIQDDVNGFAFKVGALFRPVANVKIAGSFAFPTYIDVESTYNYDLSSTFVRADNPVGTGIEYGVTFEPAVYSYELKGPSVLNANVGLEFFPFHFEVGMTATDWTNTTFSISDFNTLEDDLNRQLKRESRQTYDYHLSGRVAIPAITSVIGSGITVKSSPYQSNDKSLYILSGSYELVMPEGYSFGLSLQYLDENREYFAYTPNVNTKDPVKYSENQSTLNILIGMKFNF